MNAPVVSPLVPTVAPVEDWRTPASIPQAPDAAMVDPEAADQFPKKPFPTAIVLAVIGVVVMLSGAAGWYFSRRKAPELPSQTVAPQNIPSPPISVSELPPQAEPEAASLPAPEPLQSSPESPTKPKKNRRTKAARPSAAMSSAPAENPKAAEIANLQNLAREAYAKGNYAEPPEACAIAFGRQVLALDPADSYAKSLLENSIDGGKYQVHQAIVRKDFAAAHRTADALIRLLPGRSDLAELKTDIANAEKADEESRRAKAVAAPLLSFRVYHMHSGKAPADKGPYCRGTLSVVSGHLKYVAETALDQQLHNFEFACSEIREVKKNLRVASHEYGFHVRTTTSNINFVPEDSSASHISELASACSK